MQGQISSRDDIDRWKASLDEDVLAITKKKATTLDSFNASWLLIAAEKGDLITVYRLLENGAAVVINEPTKTLRLTALLFAAQRNHTKVVRSLLAHGADINQPNKNGWTALSIAIKNDHAEITEMLFAKMREQPDLLYETVHNQLYCAIKVGQMETVEYLMSDSCDFAFNAEELLSGLVSDHGVEMLRHVVKTGRANMVAFLLARGVSIHPKDEEIPLAFQDTGFCQGIVPQKNGRCIWVASGISI